MERASLGLLALGMAYPALVFFGLGHFEPRIFGVLLLLVLLLRQRRAAKTLIAGLSRWQWLAAGASAALALSIVVANSEALLRLYPVVINLGMLALFAISLREPPSMVERIARLKEPDLSAAGVRYTRRVTQVWCAFFVLNGALALCSALVASRAVWAIYNGCIAYVLMGLLFAGEWLVRRKVRRDEEANHG